VYFWRIWSYDTPITKSEEYLRSRRSAPSFPGGVAVRFGKVADREGGKNDSTSPLFSRRRLEIMGYRAKTELERGIAEYLAFCYREKTPARASELATFLNVSERTLRRVSNRLLGVSVFVAIRLQQVEYAEHLLRETGFAIDEIGLMSGFGDRRTFFRAIRKHFSCSPMAIRTDGHNRH
jgi:AraC-like DNA-binding protein